MDIEASPTYQALPEHAKSAWLKAVRALPPAWLLPPATDERFKGRDHCLKRLNGYGLYRALRLFREESGRRQRCAGSSFIRYTAKQLLISVDWKLIRQRIRKAI
jgi:hypothetical protein